jgi:hypothetical protein
MSGVVLDVHAGSTSPSFFRLLRQVLLGYVCAAITLAVLYLPLYELGLAPGPPVRPGPFPTNGAWSLGADFAAAAMIVLVAAWWIRVLIADAVRAPVSFGVAALAVAVTFYIPFLALRPAALSVVIALPATTWIVQRFAVGTTLPLPKPSRWVWVVLAVVGVVVFGSYRVYHPLVGLGGEGDGSMELRNPGWTDLAVTHVDGGYVGLPSGSYGPTLYGTHEELPYTVRAGSHLVVWATGPTCDSVVKLTFSVLGRKSTQSFVVSDDQGVACGGF